MDDDRAIAAHSALRGKPQRAHLIGIAGSGMRSLATVLLARGWRISGSDANPSAADHLLSLGARVIKGHSARNVPDDSDWIIHSDADAAGERRTASRGRTGHSFRKLCRRCWPNCRAKRRHSPLPALMVNQQRTAMAASVLVRSGLDPTVIGGGDADRLLDRRAIGCGPPLFGRSLRISGEFSAAAAADRRRPWNRAGPFRLLQFEGSIDRRLLADLPPACRWMAC